MFSTLKNQNDNSLVLVYPRFATIGVSCLALCTSDIRRWPKPIERFSEARLSKGAAINSRRVEVGTILMGEALSLRETPLFSLQSPPLCLFRSAMGVVHLI